MLALLVVTAAAAPPLWPVQVDPLTVALGFPHVLVERAVADEVSVYAGPHARLFDGLITEAPEPFVGYGAEFGARWFPQGAAPEGWWVGARGVLAYLVADSGATAPGGYGSLLGGYAWIAADRWVLSGALGGQYLHYTVDGMGPRGFLPAAHTAAGIAF